MREIDGMDIQQEKKILRKQIYEKIKKIDREELLKEKEEIESNLERLPVYKEAKTILFFWSLPGEVDTKDLIERAKKNGKRIALPVVINEQEMELYDYKNQSLLKQNKWGIEEPVREKSSKIEINDLNVVIVPGVAFDCQKRRLGRGKGYYDRFLEKLSDDVTTISLAFRCQILKTLPFNPLRDKKVDMVISA